MKEILFLSWVLVVFFQKYAIKNWLFLVDIAYHDNGYCHASVICKMLNCLVYMEKNYT